MSYKKAGIDSMIRRALSICSTYPSSTAEFNGIRRVGRANSYPSSFINIHIDIGLSKYLTMKAKTSSPATPETTTIEQQKKCMYVEIPYVGQTTSSIRSKFKHLSRKLRPNFDIRYFTKPTPSVQFSFQNKHRIDKYTQSNRACSVNSINCEQTCVEKTDRQAIQRMKEHRAPLSTFEQRTSVDRDTNENKLRRSFQIRGKKVDLSKLPNTDDEIDQKKVVLSALQTHGNDTRHRINWKDFRVVWRDENPYRLLIKESLLIHAYKPQLNRTTHSIPLVCFRMV
jgi:hypothetical protein